MTTPQPTLPGLELSELAGADPIILKTIEAMTAAIDALRTAGTISVIEEGDVALIFASLGSAAYAKGIAKGNFIRDAREAFRALPRPEIEEAHDVVSSEMDRVRVFLEQYDADPAAVAHPEISAPVQ